MMCAHLQSRWAKEIKAIEKAIEQHHTNIIEVHRLREEKSAQNAKLKPLKATYI
jgi:ribosomal protein S5